MGYKNLLGKIIFIISRVVIVALAIYLAYLLVVKVIQPKFLDKNCITNTNDCFYMDIWKYENSFVAEIYPTSLFIWFNGQNLYIYGIAPGVCQDKDNYEPVFSFAVDTSKGYPVFTSNPNLCIEKLDQILNYYQNNLKAEKKRIYLQADSPTNNVFDILNLLYNKKIIQ